MRRTKDIRLQLGISQAATASLLNISRVALAHAEVGRRSLPISAGNQLIFLEEQFSTVQPFTPSTSDKAFMNAYLRHKLKYLQKTLRQDQRNLRFLNKNLDEQMETNRKLEQALAIIDKTIKKNAIARSRMIELQKERIGIFRRYVQSHPLSLLPDFIKKSNLEEGIARKLQALEDIKTFTGA